MKSKKEYFEEVTDRFSVELDRYNEGWVVDNIVKLHEVKKLIDAAWQKGFSVEKIAYRLRTAYDAYVKANYDVPLRTIFKQMTGEILSEK